LTLPKAFIMGFNVLAMFRNPSINIYSHNVLRLVAFYEHLGFREIFRTPKEGTLVHVEVAPDQLTVGITSVEARLPTTG